MAATVRAWGKPGAWALDAEENEAELLQQQKEDSPVSNHQSSGGETADFPSLAAASTTKTKKKKPQTLSLQEFSAHKPAPKGLTPDEMFALPTGPRERSAEELDRNKLGGGFRSYGGGGRDEQPRRQGSFNRDSNREFSSSRADENDDWGAGKKSSGSNGFDRKERGERGGFFGDSQSRADEVDNWASNKSFVPSEPRRSEKRLESSDGGSDSGNWGRKKEEEGRRNGGAFDSLREKRGGGFESIGADSESWGKKREEVVVGGGGGGGGSRPRLNLQPRTLPVKEEQNIEVVGGVVKAKGSNPFGEARPREEVLKEKGQDWKEMEEKLDSVKIKEVVSQGPAVEKRGFWSGNDRESSWRRPDPQSAAETDSVAAEDSESGNVEQVEERDA